MRVIDFFDQAAHENPDRTLVEEPGTGKAFSFAQGKEITEQVARGLVALGNERGDRVGVYTPNCAEALLTTFSLWRIGGVWVPLNPHNAVDSTAAFAAEVELRTLFVHSVYADRIPALRAQVPSLELVVVIDDPAEEIPDTITLAALVTKGEGIMLEDWNDAHGRLEDLCALAPTGGTTGSSKPVMLTNATWAVMMDLTSRHFPRVEVPRMLVSAPMTHAAGILACLLAGQGATTVVLPGFNAAAVLDAMETEKITHTFMPPTALYDLVAAQRANPRDLSTMELLWLAAAPVATHRLAEAVEVLGPWIGQSFGQAEAPGFITWMTPENLSAAARAGDLDRLASCGRPTWGTQVGIMDDDGNLLSTGETGEIVVRGRLVTPGYHNLPEKTAEVRQHGWHHTGDIGRIDDDGFVYILDRLKDMIISGGFNVYPSEVETAMMQLPGVAQCAVIGVPHDRWGEEVTAVVVPTLDSDRDADALIAACKQAIGSVKSPKQVHFVDELPLTPARKVDKKVIRAQFWQGHPRAI
ncbi:AMP-binding protein [Nocardioides sp. AE5]|uniref:AMP-binding protein n=1 Tax=Nocardioides sp. AE5 TaxID=2962573 RepID=UPI002880E2A3|nr:AMP-binding protein [Nocardioides sp. AE5]MDT0200682.1 AMP-binding protein [Nocardioides sp. AE5]